MKRIVGYSLALALLLVVLGARAALYDVAFGGTEAPEPTTITDYRADVTLDADGDLHAVETITVRFPGGRHGIFRFFDTGDAPDPHGRAIPEDVTVQRDGADEPFEVLDERDGRIETIKIGSADTFLDAGEHTYVIGYTIDGVLTGDGDTSQFYWDLVPGGWRQPIDRARLAVHLPAPSVGDVDCAVGAGAVSGCTVSGAGTADLAVTVRDLAPNTPVTIRADMDLPTPPPGHERPWTARWDPVLGGSGILLAVVVLLALGAFGAGLVLAGRSRETPPGFPLTYAPPEGLGPAQAHYLLTERTGNEQYVASLMHAAERGAVRLDRQGKAWTVTDASDPSAWGRLDPVTLSVAHLLSGPGTSFTATPKSVQAGERLKSELSGFGTGVKTWGASAGLVVPAGLRGFGPIVVLAALGLTAWIAFGNPAHMTALGLVPGAFGIAAAPIALPGASTRRTPQARQLWAQAGGFRRVLSTPSAQDRFDFSGRQELWTAYLPWAVAFGVAEQWAQKYRDETGAEPPTPVWIGGYGPGGFSAGDMADDFGSTLGSAVSAYQATQSSSSGGGGFSGGGGGGGGGGGSW